MTLLKTWEWKETMATEINNIIKFIKLIRSI